MSAPAAYATPPTPGAVHELDTVEMMARLLGTPLMPWQSQVARVATERRPDGRGWKYPTVILTVPRQSGKTTIMAALMAQRTLRYPGTKAFYTAQSGKDARERWTDLVEKVEQHLPDHVKVRRGAGAECMEWVNGRGQVRTFAPTRTALHGYTPELVMIDEAFAFDEDLGAALMGAISPAQITLAERQLWIVSTAGDASSAWLKEWVDRGRAAVDDPMSGVAYFEWSAAPDLDLSNPASFAQFHPAVGYTQTVEALAQSLESMPRGEFERAFGNRWSVAKNSVIAHDDIMACLNPIQSAPENLAHVTLAYDVAPDRSSAVIYACWTDTAGIHLRPYKAAPGTWWIVDTLKEARTMGVRKIGADDGGAARSTNAAAELTGLEITKLTAREFAAATGDIIQAFQTHGLDHDGNQDLLSALDGAALRRLGETDAWSRRDSIGAIHHLTAATIALRVHTFTETAPAPMIIT